MPVTRVYVLPAVSVTPVIVAPLQLQAPAITIIRLPCVTLAVGVICTVLADGLRIVMLLHELAARDSA